MSSKKKQEYFERVYKNIEENGFHTTYIMEELNFTPFGYSTGIYKNFKIPELFISGLPGNLTGELIQKYADKYKFGLVPINEKVEDLTDRFPVFFIKVTNESLNEHTLSSIKYYENDEYEYLQLIFPDLNGHFPNEADYNYDQKIFGEIL
jgi:hypothetical protein